MTQRTCTQAVAFAVAILVTLSASGAMRMGRGHRERPAASDFGPAPRNSASGLYLATLQGATTLKPRKMYTLQVLVADGANDEAVTNTTIDIDGGMPQHGHGLPTRPRVTKNLGAGAYEISGLRCHEKTHC